MRRVIQASEINTLPKRADLLDLAQIKATNATIRVGERLLFLPVYLREEHLQDEPYKPTKYKVVLCGSLADGRKATVILDDIALYFEIRLKNPPGDELTAEVAEQIANLSENGIVRHEVIQAKPFHYYHEKPAAFLRMYFNKTKQRQAAIKAARTAGYETTTDDWSNYYRVACRDHMTTFSSHAYITNYKIVCDTRYKGLVIRTSINNFTRADEILPNTSVLMCWDIETYSPTGDLPLADNPEDKLFCLSMTFHMAHQSMPLIKYCLTLHRCTESADFINIVCRDEIELCHAFSEVFALMYPEYIFGFNDSDYDWKFLITRASQTPDLLSAMAATMDISSPYYPYTDKNILDFNYRRETIKLDATTDIIGAALTLPGYLAVDVRTLFRKLYPTAEYSSLKWFLSKFKLAPKEDMPISQLFSIYAKCAAGDLSPESMADMALVAQYCVTDAARCAELLSIKNCIPDAIEMSNISYVSVFDAFFRANGMKVINLTIAIGQRAPFNIRFSNKQNADFEDGKYPGAEVIAPEKGLQVSKLSIAERIAASSRPKYAEWANTPAAEITRFNEFIKTHGPQPAPADIPADLPPKFRDFLAEQTGRPIVGLDFASLYPSLMRAYNLSPEYCIRDVKQAQELSERGVKLTPVKFDYNGKTRSAYFVAHMNIYDKTHPDFRFGIFPYILNELFTLRNKYKKEFKALEKEIEHLTAKRATATAELAAINERLSALHIRCNYYDAKQKAVKVFMNTFYGVAGKKESSFFELTVAGGVTSWGKRSLQFAYTHVMALGCHVYYGDTDSLYISVPEHLFADVDRRYYSGEMSKLDYWTELVKITFAAIVDIRNKINAAFIADNGTEFLSMSFEEVLFPVIFLAKKKYYGVPHIDVINFFPDKLFIRGLEVIKRGQAQILRTIFDEMMRLTMNPANTHTVMEIVFNNIDEIYKRQWQPSDFVQSKVYKPNKKNVAVHTFVSRMAQQNIIIAPNERFEFILVKRNPYSYDLRGRRSDLSVGDKMELLNTKYEIDLDYYMTGSILGQLARLITYDPQFHVEPLSDSLADGKRAEDTIYANAVKHVTQYASRYFAKYNTFGKTYQTIYRTVNAVVRQQLTSRDAISAELLSANVNYDDFETWIINYAEAYSDRLIDSNPGRAMVRALLGEVDSTGDDAQDQKNIARELIKMQRAFYADKHSISETREDEYKSRMQILRKRIRETYDELMQVYRQHTGAMQYLVEMIKSSIAIKDQQTDAPREYTTADFPDLADKLASGSEYMEELARIAKIQVDKIYSNALAMASIKKLRYIYLNLVTAMVCVKKTRSIVAYLRLKAAAAAHYADVPSESARLSMRAQNAKYSAGAMDNIPMY
jgi:DNA polymerase elongation subunit (family B)